MMGRFTNIVKSEKPVLVDFYTEWCVPCKQMTPILKEVKNGCKKSIRIIKVNVDKNPLIASKYNIKNIPTIMVFQSGEPVWTGTGVKTKNELLKILKQLF